MKFTSAHWGTYRIDGDRLLPLATDPAPSRIGAGWVSAARDRNSRILRPAIRRGWLEGDDGAGRCRDSFVEVDWDRAIELAAGEIAHVRTEYGNGVIYAGSYGWASAGRFHHAQSQLKRLLNLAGGFVGARDTYSHAAAEVLLPHVVGMSQDAFQDAMTSWPLIAEHCTLLVAFGGISRRTAQICSSGTTGHEVEHWLGRLKARIVTVSPQRGAPEGADWLSIRPGTDAALILALCHTLLTEDLHDEDFLQRCTSGWPEFRDYVSGKADALPKSAEWAAPLCDIPAETIKALARDMAQSRTLVTLSWSLQRADHGEQPLWAGLALASMLGQIGRPGTGFGFGYGSVAPVGRPKKVYRWPSFPQGRNPVSDYIPVARITDMLEHPGEPYRYNGQERTYPDIKLVYWAGGNPFHHHQDLNRLERAWCRPRAVIVNDHSWTATARRADIVLPTTTPLEREDIMMSRREAAIVHMSKMFEPMGEALDDHEICRRLAAALGFEEAFTEGRSTEEWLRHLWDRACEARGKEGVTLPSFEAFRSAGRFDMPGSDNAATQLASFVKDPEGHPLHTESGRITLFNRTIAGFGAADCPGHPAWMPPVESLLGAPQGALHLISGQPDTRLHGQNDRGAEAAADKVQGREPCYLHPDTAASRGIGDGSIVRIRNARGACLAGVRFDPGLRRDCIALASGAWFDPAEVDGNALEVHGNPNVLTMDKGCSELSQGNIAHTAIVFVELWDAPLPPLTIDRPPPLAVRVLPRETAAVHHARIEETDAPAS